MVHSMGGTYMLSPKSWNIQLVYGYFAKIKDIEGSTWHVISETLLQYIPRSLDLQYHYWIGHHTVFLLFITLGILMWSRRSIDSSFPNISRMMSKCNWQCDILWSRSLWTKLWAKAVSWLNGLSMQLYHGRWKHFISNSFCLLG